MDPVEPNNLLLPTEKTFPIYIIRSSWSLSRIDEFLKDYEDVSFLRIVHNKYGMETNKTIVILKRATYEKLCNDGYGNLDKSNIPKLSFKEKSFYVYPFSFEGEDLPKNGRTLFIPVPKNLVDDDNFVVSSISDKLLHFCEDDIIKNGTWDITIPLVSREKGGIKGGCFITFSEEVSNKEIAATRILLCDTYWPERTEGEERLIFRCFWAKGVKEKNKGNILPKKILAKTNIFEEEQPMLK